eukprot:GHVU01074883.1.p1 GENE.GHVU01074883.1~~GHVU01074883.1.p1  ORF type:complete len:103 (-),score=0.40 GHVU01074883.1:194-502(-)
MGAVHQRLLVTLKRDRSDFDSGSTSHDMLVRAQTSMVTCTYQLVVLHNFHRHMLIDVRVSVRCVQVSKISGLSVKVIGILLWRYPDVVPPSSGHHGDSSRKK